MDKILINDCLGSHSRDYFKAVAAGNDVAAKYHYGVISGFLAALLTTGYITAMEHMVLYKEYVWGD